MNACVVCDARGRAIQCRLLHLYRSICSRPYSSSIIICCRWSTHDWHSGHMFHIKHIVDEVLGGHGHTMIYSAQLTLCTIFLLCFIARMILYVICRAQSMQWLLSYWWDFRQSDGLMPAEMDAAVNGAVIFAYFGRNCQQCSSSAVLNW